MGRPARPRPRRDLGSCRPAQRLRRGVAADGCVQDVSSGGEGVAGHLAGASSDRRGRRWEEAAERGLAARSSDIAVGTHACTYGCALRPRVLRGEGSPGGPRWVC
jgi:hypothetical protein